jgi:hypothetical protein
MRWRDPGRSRLPLARADAALLTLLPPGTYTIHATGPVGGSGVALIEVYEVP